MDSYIKNIKKSYQAVSAENLIIQNFLERFKGLLEKFNSEARKNSLNLSPITDSNNNTNISSPGVPGYYKDSLVAIDSTFSHLSVNVCDVATKSYDQVNELIENMKTHGNMDFDTALNKLKKSGEALLGAVESRLKKNTHNDTTKKIDSHLSKMQKGKSNDKNITKLNGLYQEAIVERTSLAATRNEIIDAARAPLKDCLEAIEVIKDLIVERDNFLMKLLEDIGIRYVEVVSGIQNDIANLTTAIKSFNFNQDMDQYCKSKKLARYNIDIPDFEVYECDFDDDETTLPQEVISDFPIGIADVVLSFSAALPPEMSCIEGKKILLMEPPADDWCCVMNPITRELGFVPSYCLNQTSFSLGIVLEDKASLISSAEGIKVKVGDFLGILEDNVNDKYYKVENAFGEQGKVPKDLLGVVF